MLEINTAVVFYEDAIAINPIWIECERGCMLVISGPEVQIPSPVPSYH